MRKGQGGFSNGVASAFGSGSAAAAPAAGMLPMGGLGSSVGQVAGGLVRFPFRVMRRMLGGGYGYGAGGGFGGARYPQGGTTTPFSLLG